MTDEAIFEQEEISDLPDSWVWVNIENIARTTSGGTPSRKIPEYYEGDIPWVKSGELEDTVIQVAEESITQDALANSSAKIFPAGTPVVAMYGATVGRTGLLGIDAATNQAVCAIFPYVDGFSSRYIMYWLFSQRDNLIAMSMGGAQPNINQGIIRAYPFPLAPLNEQRRIVDEIEAQFTRLDAGIAALKRLEANLKRYKASVLKAACEGDLVPQDPSDEPASELLARILRERREQWEADKLAEYKAKGKKPPKNWQDKYKEPVEPDTDDLPDLPEGWVWTSFDQLLEELKNGYFGGAPNTEPPGIMILRIGAVRPLSVDLSDRGYFDEYDEKMSNYFLRENDLLFTRYNGNIEYVGACGMVRGLDERDILYPDKLIRATLVDSDTSIPTYLEMYFATHLPRTLIEKMVVSSAGQNGISGTKLKSLPVALPPTDEQHEIVTEAERLLSIADELEKATRESMKRAERLRQSILKEAFAGRLVPQDLSDEPASELLARIRAEREE